ncbi:MAG: ion channel [Ktedonobacterales bacterium]
MENQSTTVETGRRREPRLAYRLTDSYGLVLVLFLVDYIAVSTLLSSSWGRVFTIFFLGATLLVTLRASQSRRIWQLLAVAYLVVGTLSALISALVPGAASFSQLITILAGVLLLVTPVVILGHISTHRVVTTQTVLGAICVYLLIGFSFAFIYSAAALLMSSPFFIGNPPATINNTLFFSYTTLTTVGYGNLIPASNLGQTFAMLEVLFGQIYLVLIVARLVSLWGKERTRAE